MFQNISDIKELYLVGNRFKCDCEQRQFRDWLNKTFPDTHDAFCFYPTSMKTQMISNYTLNFIDCDNHLELVLVLGILGFICVTVPVPIAIAYYRLDMKYWWYFGWRRAGHRQFDGADRLYDAFVCYSRNELDWVTRVLMERLENDPDEQFRLCINDRDFDIGGDIVDNITRRISVSRRVIFVLTREFVRGYWGGFELNLALMQAIEARRHFVILIFMEDIPKKDLPRHLQCFMRHVTYTTWPQHEGRAREIFWKKFKLALRNRGQDENAV